MLEFNHLIFGKPKNCQHYLIFCLASQVQVKYNSQ